MRDGRNPGGLYGPSYSGGRLAAPSTFLALVSMGLYSAAGTRFRAAVCTTRSTPFMAWCNRSLSRTSPIKNKRSSAKRDRISAWACSPLENANRVWVVLTNHSLGEFLPERARAPGQEDRLVIERKHQISKYTGFRKVSHSSFKHSVSGQALEALVRGPQCFVVAFTHNLAFVHHVHGIAVLDGLQSVRHHDERLIAV